MFADDTNVFISGKDPVAIANQINGELTTFVEWLRSNRLSLNIGKTNYMLFSPTRSKSSPDLQIKIDGSTLEQVHSCKFLGVLLDDKLTWKAQINHISGKISKSIGVLSKARKYLDINSLLSLYYTMLYPYLLYCIIAWGKANTGIINPLIKTQKRAIRLMCSLRKYDSTSIYFKELKIMRLDDLYNYSVNIFMYKLFNGDLPPLFNDYFTKNQSHHNHSTRHGGLLRPPLIKTVLANNFIKKQGVSIWNYTIQNISWTGLIGSFKSNLKKHILDLY